MTMDTVSINCRDDRKLEQPYSTDRDTEIFKCALQRVWHKLRF